MLDLDERLVYYALENLRRDEPQEDINQLKIFDAP
jgi:hypothetical protein